MKNKKLAIIGASYLQEPLIQKAKSMGIETHVFAWATGDVGEKSADYFYPISIVEKENILQKCREIGIDGICSIASDLASITVNYVAAEMGLTGNSMECSYISTNKYAMRKAFMRHGDPSPQCYRVCSAEELVSFPPLTYPVIVKPVDRSGSRGITKLDDPDRFNEAIESAIEQGFEKWALVEAFVVGQEYSVECISWQGEHHFLALTKKYTTGTPHFIETGHLEPAPIYDSLLERVKAVTMHALDSLKIQNGASHTELKIDADGTIKLIEIGGRMGGDCIGSDLVELSTGVDFVRAVIQVALGEKPDLERKTNEAAGIRFVFSDDDLSALAKLKEEHPEYLVREDINRDCHRQIVDSSTRYGYFLMHADHAEALEEYLPE